MWWLLKRKGTYVLIAVVLLLLGLVMILTGKSQGSVTSIGCSVVAGGIIALLQLWHQYIQEKEHTVSEVMAKAGICMIHQKRSLDRYDDLVADFDKRIDVTGYSLRGFFESFRERVVEKIHDDPSVKVRVLVVDPDSVFSQHRERLEGFSPGTFRECLQRVHEYFAQESHVEIRKIDSPLPTMIFRVDNIMFVGPYLAGSLSKTTATMELERGGWLFDVYENEFEVLWRDAKPL